MITVETTYGYVRGVPCPGAPKITVFRGIPYAAPPVGRLRWRAPEPPRSWTGERICDTFGTPCMQIPAGEGAFSRKDIFSRFPSYPPAFSEDCLYLNVWTPASTDQERLPVMVYIHGGGLTHGMGHDPRISGEQLCRQGIVLVSVQYRLNLFGFFGDPTDLEETGSWGNYGLKDQIFALKWVQENIRAFGGDPGNVTVFGQSAGGYCTHLLSLSRASENLMHKAIVQSGDAVSGPNNACFCCTPVQMRERSQLFLALSGAKDFWQLRQLPAEHLLELFGRYRELYGHWFGVMTDGVLLHDWPDRMAADDIRQLPLIIGSTLDETYLFPEYGPEAVRAATYREALLRLRGPYFAPYANCMSPENDTQALRLLNRAWAFDYMTSRHALARIRSGGRPAYVYTFTREPPGEDRPGAYHSSCLWYTFGTLRHCWRPFTQEDEALAETMGRYWTAFAKTGDPNAPGLLPWPPFTAEDPREMLLGVPCRVGKLKDTVPELDRLEAVYAHLGG